MAWLRLTVATPLPGQGDELKRLLGNLENAVATRPGYLMGGVFTSAQNSGEMGRFSIWRTSEEADHASMLEAVIALRSQINGLALPGHLEGLHEISGVSHNIPS